MPDLFSVLVKKWKFIFGLTFLVAIVVLIAALLSPKKYLSVATAFPANSVLTDKARLFNNNIEGLYSGFGSPDELDRVLGTASLDTVFIFVSKQWNLAGHYLIEASKESDYKAAKQLKSNSSIIKSDYGELKVKVWDHDSHMASELANALMQKLQQMHQQLQMEANAVDLQKLKEAYDAKQKEYLELLNEQNKNDSLKIASRSNEEISKLKFSSLVDQLQQYQKLISQYELTVNTNPNALLIVENARPSLKPDKPKVLEIVLFAGFASFVFFFLLALFVESRKPAV